MICPTCSAPIPAAAILSAAGALLNSKRKHKRGTPKVLRPCPLCGEQFGAKAIRRHVPLCRRERKRTPRLESRGQ